MPKGQKIELAPNVPIFGTLKYVDITSFEGQEPSLRLTGTWDGTGEGFTYTHPAVFDQLVALGVAAVGQGHDQYGNPRLKVLRSNVRLAVLKRTYKEAGDKKERRETVVIYEGTAWPTREAILALPRITIPPPKGAAAPAASAPAAAAAGGPPSSAAAAGPGAPTSPAPPASAPRRMPTGTELEALKKDMRAGFRILHETARTVVAMARAVWMEGLQLERQDIDQNALARFTNQLMIRCEKEGLVAYPGMRKDAAQDQKDERPTAPPATPPARAKAPEPPPAQREMAAVTGSREDGAMPPLPGEDDDLPF